MAALSGPDFLKKLDTDLEPLRVELTSSKIVKAWCDGELSREQVFEVMKQIYCLAQNAVENFATWAVTCPFPEVKDYFYEQLIEEYTHPAMLLRMAREWGYDERVMHEAEPTPEWGGVYYFYQYLATKHPVERVAAQNFASEGTVPRWFAPMGHAAVKHYGAEKGSGFYDFFFVHIEVDAEQHAPIAKRVIEKYGGGDEALQRRAAFAARHTLEMQIKGHQSWYDEFVVKKRITTASR